ncbi:MAG: SDR family NAD(P)-dependent oxidoreductase [Halioglobus sp.]|nr:SDR family NAD(P)-dependent oxidoreductase [Halioglobus sp.]MCB1710295.1 SDR family NAD(P)-dependent oxidoreductase [Halioglobus sp.]MCP5123467.1 SDR family NAD(P)-dependent oxidoreductase [Pseudomonadales bacterium]MCP5193695.1 SDR family NAD(P)-dependent oxidoreductase [Pseudomonadales bacterium]
MKPNALITGVSTGIGFDAARLLIERDYRVFGSVRKQTDADKVSQELGADFTPLLFDVTDEPAIAAAAQQVAEAVGDQGLRALVNNSGVSGAGPLMHMPVAELRQMLEVNVLGLLAVTQAFLPLLGARNNCPHPPGRIVNLSSISGRLVFPFVGAYGASKHAVEALNDGLRRELRMYGIEVIAIEPGSIRTPIWEKAAGADARYNDTDYAEALAGLPEILDKMVRTGKPVEVVSDAIHEAITARRPKTRYPLTWMVHAPRALGDRTLDKLLCKEMGLE